MARPRTSVIWQMPADEFRALVARCRSINEVLAHFGLQSRGHNYRTFMRRAAEDGIDLTHIRENRPRNWRLPSPLEQLLVNGRAYHGYKLKRRLLNAGMLDEVCAQCGIGPEWNGKPLSLQLDHVNGDHLDNRPENLRLLCPNCHSQTETFAGKGRPSKAKDRRTACSGRGALKPAGTSTGLCGACSRRSQRKVERPELTTLREQIEKLGYTGTGRLYGVSDNAIRKWLREDH